MFSNSQILSSVLNNFIQPYVVQFASARLGSNPTIQMLESGIKNILSVSPNYSLANEISWAIPSITSATIESKLESFISKISEENIPDMAHNLVDAMLEKVEKEGTVPFFETIYLEVDDVKKLKRLLDLNLPIKESVKYKLILE